MSLWITLKLMLDTIKSAGVLIKSIILIRDKDIDMPRKHNRLKKIA